jgi:hypothetical protein
MPYNKRIASWAAVEIDRRLKRATTDEERRIAWNEADRARRDPEFRQRLAEIAEKGRFMSGPHRTAQIGLGAASVAPFLPWVGSALGPVGTGLGILGAAGLTAYGAANLGQAYQRQQEGLPWKGQAGVGALDILSPLGVGGLLRGLKGVKAVPDQWTRLGLGSPAAKVGGDIPKIPDPWLRDPIQQSFPTNFTAQGASVTPLLTPTKAAGVAAKVPSPLSPGTTIRRPTSTTRTSGGVVLPTTASSGVGGFRLPQALVRSSPRYINDEILFGSHLDKALYIVRNKTVLSRSDEKFMKVLRQHFRGESDAAIRARGDSVLERVKAGRVVDGQRVPSSSKVTAETQPVTARPSTSTATRTSQSYESRGGGALPKDLAGVSGANIFPKGAKSRLQTTADDYAQKFKDIIAPTTGASGVDSALAKMKSSVDPTNYLAPANVWLRQFLKNIDEPTLTALRLGDEKAELTLVDRMLRDVRPGGPTSAEYHRPMTALFARIPKGAPARIVKKGQKTGERILQPGETLEPLKGLPTERVISGFRAGMKKLNPEEWLMAEKQIPIQFQGLAEAFKAIPTNNPRRSAAIAYQAARHRFDVLTDFIVKMTGVKSPSRLRHPQIRRVEGVTDRNLSRVIRGAAGGVIRKGEVDGLNQITKQLQEVALQLLLLIGGTAIAQQTMPQGGMNAAAG